MKIIDQKGKLFGKINLVDLAVLLLLLCAVLLTAYKLTSGKTSSNDSSEVTVRYTLYIRGLREVSVNAVMAETEEINDAEYGGSVGHIVGDVIKQKAVENVVLEDGTYATATYDDRYDLYVTLETEATETETSLRTHDNRDLYFGGTIGIDNGHVQTFGEIVELEIIR